MKNLLAIAALVGLMSVPMLSAAQSRDHDKDKQRSHGNQSSHRQDTKNEWRNIAIGSGGLAVLGLLTHDNTLTFAGTAGALYSVNRYEQDRKSQSGQNHLRAEYFSRDHFNRDGHRYDRRTVTKNGHRYYQFVRSH